MKTFLVEPGYTVYLNIDYIYLSHMILLDQVFFLLHASDPQDLHIQYIMQKYYSTYG